MPLPDFLILGAGKAGTSSLYHYLRQHPEVFMSAVKEPRFFAIEGGPPFAGPGARRANKEAVWTLTDYEALFEGVRGESAVGEASPMYLYTPGAAERIRERLPAVKMVIILRDPAERAFSSYLMNVHAGYERLTLPDAVDQEERRRRENWAWGSYITEGLYHQHLTCFFDLFDREQIRIFRFERFKRDPVGVCRDIFRFLGVDADFEPDTSIRLQTTGLPRHRWLSAVMDRHNPLKGPLKAIAPEVVRRRIWRLRAWNMDKPPLSEAERRMLVDAFREDTLKLQRLLDWDVGEWVAAPRGADAAPVHT